jgi:hypothetical protein
VETLQFANAKIRHISQNNNNNNNNNSSSISSKNDTSTDKLVNIALFDRMYANNAFLFSFLLLKIIDAVLDIDHLILNIVNTFKEQHFSFETQQLSGQLDVLLMINPTQYSIEANLKQLRFKSLNIIDPNNVNIQHQSNDRCYCCCCALHIV